MNRTPENIQDEWLVLQCQDGEREALSALIARWQPRLAGFAWRLTGDREAARDVVQESWMAIVRGLRRLDDPATFRTWAFRIVRNKCADWTRRRRVQRRTDDKFRDSVEPASAEDANESAGDAATDIGRLRAAIDELAPDHRAVLTLHYLYGMSVLEMTRVLEIPEGTVKSRLFHARNILGEILERATS